MGTKVTRLLLAVATILSLAASACDGQNLPTTPTVQPSPSAGPTPVPPAGPTPTPSPTPSPTPTPATYRVKGHVSHYGHFPLRGARVEVTVGAARDVTLTDADGRFMFNGLLGGDAEFTATKDGYEPSVQRVHVTSDVDVYFALEPFGYIDIRGTYDLEITAAADCRDNLPEAVRTRTYTAVVTEDRGGFLVTVTGAEFLGNTFHGGIDEQGVWFRTYHSDEIGYNEFVERLTPSTALQIEFSVRPTVSRTKLIGTMDGNLAITSTELGGRAPPGAYCSSDRHRFLMSRE